jgi:hypothetical protein
LLSSPPQLRRVDGPRCFRPLRWQGNVSTLRRPCF